MMPFDAPNSHSVCFGFPDLFLMDIEKSVPLTSHQVPQCFIGQG